MARRRHLLMDLSGGLFLLAAGCGGPPTHVGDVCQVDAHCGGKEDSLLLVCDHSVPGGACTVEGCTTDDTDTPEVNEEEETCPEGSRCVREGADLFRCRRSCAQHSDCDEVIVCREHCTMSDDVEKCRIECQNEMECFALWDLGRSDLHEDVPRACILKGSLYRQAP